MTVVRVLGVLALLTVPAIAAAQVTGSSSWSGLGPIGLPLPQIAHPLPPIGLPLPPIGLSPRVDPVAPSPVVPSAPSSHGEGRRDGRTRPHPRSPVVYVQVPYLSAPSAQFETAAALPPTSSESPAAEPPVLTGHLRLELPPARDVQVFVDGEFVGMLDAAGDLELAPGTRRIEIRAEGYDTLMFDARIAAGRAITYRGALVPQPTTRTPALSAPARQDHTFYFIPGCYLGNVPPEQVRLPARCDLKLMITHRP